MTRPTLVVMSGMPGTGKSTLAKAIAQRIHAPVFSVDPIESAMLDAGIRRSFQTGLAAYMVAHALAAAQLEAGRDAIIDAVNSVRYVKSMWAKLARRHRARLRIIECTCSDEQLQRRRLRTRRRGLSKKLREPTWAEVRRRAHEWAPWTKPALVVDAAEPLVRNTRKAVLWIVAG